MSDLKDKVIITVAPTGSIPTRKDTPYLPITPEEVAQETKRSYDAGASVVHLHARNPDTGEPTSDLKIFQRYLEQIKKLCPIITQITTGGGATTLGLTPQERLKAVEELRPDSASLNAGSMNFGRKIFPNPPDVMEAFAKRMKELEVKPEFEIYDVSMINNVSQWIIKAGLADLPYRFSLVMGVMGGIPASLRNLAILIDDLPEGSTWQVVGIGRHQLTLGACAVSAGGGLRVGFEDNIYVKRGVLAKSNADLVSAAVKIVEAMGKEVANTKEAKKIIGVKGM
ncbi:MAG: 3-keto-5-aminohexanoate cleavage protein [Actinomycetota bacterium]|nr:3-keto-5-aminohexanoate cleavage protein [Actinomycetota bacterium]